MLVKDTKKTQGSFFDSTDEYFAQNAQNVVTSDPYGKARISNIEDEQYFFCHKIRIICMYSS